VQWSLSCIKVTGLKVRNGGVWTAVVVQYRVQLLNDRERWVNERRQSYCVWGYCTGFRLIGLRKTVKHISQNSRKPRWDSNRLHPDHSFRVSQVLYPVLSHDKADPAVSVLYVTFNPGSRSGITGEANDLPSSGTWSDELPNGSEFSSLIRRRVRVVQFPNRRMNTTQFTAVLCSYPVMVAKIN
jgi:hypothetical protein